MEIAPVRSASTVQTEAESASGGTPTAQTETAGSAELAAAEGFLSGKYGTRDSSQAAKLLWKAVGKENTTAILLLSNLYLAGDGVPKSCDQARMLLRAAARKNVTEAASKLRQLQQSGCP
jgi:TPR repeat protein